MTKLNEDICYQQGVLCPEKVVQISNAQGDLRNSCIQVFCNQFCHTCVKHGRPNIDYIDIPISNE